MGSISKEIESFGSRIANEFSRDRTRSVVLGFAVIVCIALLSKQMISSDVPKGAMAGNIQPTETQRSARRFLPHSDRRNVAPGHHVRGKHREITRDLFAADMDAFEPLSDGWKSNSFVPATANAANGGSDIQKRLLRAQAKSLDLQSTMVSANPVAIINGRMLRIGEWINGFELTEITPRGCSVRKNGTTIMLDMSS